MSVDNGPTYVTTADFNGDGRPDLAIVNNANGTVDVLLNTTAAGATAPSFAATQSFATGTTPEGIAVGDFDGDGRPDIAVAAAFSKTVTVLANTTPVGATTVSFAATQHFGAGNNPRALQAANFLGDGRADLAVTDMSDNSVSVLVNTTPTTYTTPVVVLQSGTNGVQELNLGNPVQLTPANASILAADPQGDIVGEFPGNGVWEYRPTTGWVQINGVDASALAMNAQGEIAASFPGYGVATYLPASGWNTRTPSVATRLAIDALGDVVGEFPGYGLQLYRPSSGWQTINGVDANLLAMDPQGDIVANFHNVGVGEYTQSGGWQLINGVEATALTMDGHGNVMATFQSYGVGEYRPSAGWQTLTGADAALLSADALGRVFGSFTGAGVWEFDPWAGWHKLSATDAAALAVA
jgi:hypothetical protein